MLCEECKKRPATVVMTILAGGQQTTRHLCRECMEKFQEDVQEGLLSSMLSAISAKQDEPDIKCSQCGLSFSEFRKTGKLGCVQCYESFRTQLMPLMERVHGITQHRGHMPESFHEDEKQQDTIAVLKSKMEKAVLAEEFEQAAMLRDQIRALSETAMGGE